MYAVIETGGKQYKVQEGDTLAVERLGVAKNSAFTFDKVLLIGGGTELKIGQPYLNGAAVSATVLDELKDEKVLVYKFKPKTGYNRKNGHRQIYNVVKIEKIQG